MCRGSQCPGEAKIGVHLGEGGRREVARETLVDCREQFRFLCRCLLGRRFVHDFSNWEFRRLPLLLQCLLFVCNLFHSSLLVEQGLHGLLKLGESRLPGILCRFLVEHSCLVAHNCLLDDLVGSRVGIECLVMILPLLHLKSGQTLDVVAILGVSARHILTRRELDLVLVAESTHLRDEGIAHVRTHRVHVCDADRQILSHLARRRRLWRELVGLHLAHSS